ncbi:MAG: hypothetical protein EOO74_09015 [Myxococcales bacterium]|nr:MAG: hypothetical protein EOO74_09015 [Myxococcales bacterium]
MSDGVLHVGDRIIELGDRVDQFVLGATGVYWMRATTLMFTTADGETRKVHDLGDVNLAISADHSVFATVDRSRGPTDDYGTHVLQVAVFDTRTGEQLYRTPDEEPEEGADLADLYSEITPLLHGVSNDLVFFDEETIRLDDGSAVPVSMDSEQIPVYEGMADTLFTDGYHVAIRGEGNRREVAPSTAYGSGRLSPDRKLLFDVGMWPAPAVAYDAATGRERTIDAPWGHFTLVRFTDDGSFHGIAEKIDERADNVLQASQVVTCRVRTLACTPVSPVIRHDGPEDNPILTETLSSS